MFEYKCRIVRVVDGDTVDIDIDLGFGVWLENERVRIVGIDTPETRTRDLEEKKFGLLAKARVEGLLPIGSIQILLSQEFKGKFGRILGDIRTVVNGTPIEVSELLLLEHLAVAYNDNDASMEAAHRANWATLIQEGRAD